MMRWQEGPKSRGCIYHKQGICNVGGDSIIADVFIMPSIVRYRPVAITVGRYRDFQAVQKRKWQVHDPERLPDIARTLGPMFETIGTPADVARELGAEVHEFVKREASLLKRILATLPDPSGLDSGGPPDDDDIPF